MQGGYEKMTILDQYLALSEKRWAHSARQSVSGTVSTDCLSVLSGVSVIHLWCIFDISWFYVCVWATSTWYIANNYVVSWTVCHGLVCPCTTLLPYQYNMECQGPQLLSDISWQLRQQAYIAHMILSSVLQARMMSYGLTYISESAQQYVSVRTEVRVAVCLYSDCSPNSHSVCVLYQIWFKYLL